MGSLEVIPGGAVLVRDGVVEAVGPYRDLKSSAAGADVVELDGVLFPGFVDPHTHAVFGMPRLDDHERRARGMDYKAIAAEGGGILSSVRDLRARTPTDLRELARRRLRHLLAHGTTTVEVKSGYGLDTETELGTLSIIGDLAAGLPALVPTFLGAHEVPLEYRSRRPEYVQLVIERMLPAVAAQGIARFCDVFCEPGVFSPDESRQILLAARIVRPQAARGHTGRVGGAELGAAPADHLARAPRRDRGGRRVDTVAVPARDHALSGQD
jgi:imidazolonepropionase